MKILFVTGPSFSGKSIYIRKTYADAKVVKISTFKEVVDVALSNEELEELAKNSYFYCREALMNTIRKSSDDDTVILECQLLNKASRKFYLDAVREVSEAPVECVLMRPEEEKIKELLADYPTLVSLHQYELGKLEMPSVEEGFAAVHIIRPEFEDTDWHTLVHSS